MSDTLDSLRYAMASSIMPMNEQYRGLGLPHDLEIQNSPYDFSVRLKWGALLYRVERTEFERVIRDKDHLNRFLDNLYRLRKEAEMQKMRYEHTAQIAIDSPIVPPDITKKADKKERNLKLLLLEAI